MPSNGPDPRRPCLSWADPVPLLLVSGILFQCLDNNNTTTSLLHIASRLTMGLGYVVEAAGRTGPELRLARQAHELIATGISARLGLLLPHNTTTTAEANGRPIEVRLPFLLATWLILGTITVTDEVRAFFIYQYAVGAERLWHSATRHLRILYL